MALVDLAILLSVVGCVGTVLAVIFRTRAEPAPTYGGSWKIQSRSEELDLQSYLGIYCVRFEGDRETGRILIGHVADDSPDWEAEYLDLTSRAETRAGFLNNK